MGEGRIGPFRPLQPNCQTPPSLAALFSGTNSATTGISGFDQPDFADPSRAMSRRGFNMLAPGTRMIWDWAAEAGLDVRISHLPYVDVTRLGAALRRYAYGFGSPVVAPAVFDCREAEALFGRAQLANVSGDGWAPLWAFRPSEGPDTGRASGLASRRLIEGREKLVFTGAWRVERLGTDVVSRHLRPLLAGGLQHWYRRGELGRTLQQGGCGDAERLFVETLRLVAGGFEDEWLDSLATARRGLVMAYQPALDLALHELAGYLVEDCAHWSADREAVVLPLLVDMLSDLDRTIARTAALLAPDDRMIISSDHGMTPVDLTLRPNALLRGNGYLELDGDGRIDPKRSVCFYHPAENGLLCLNRELLAERRISEHDLLAKLGSALDRASGRTSTLRSWPGLETVSGAPPWLSARHYLSGGRFVQVKADPGGAVAERSIKTGEHIATSDDSELEGTVIELSHSRRLEGQVKPDITEVHRLVWHGAGTALLPDTLSA